MKIKLGKPTNKTGDKSPANIISKNRKIVFVKIISRVLNLSVCQVPIDYTISTQRKG